MDLMTLSQISYLRRKYFVLGALCQFISVAWSIISSDKEMVRNVKFSKSNWQVNYFNRNSQSTASNASRVHTLSALIRDQTRGLRALTISNLSDVKSVLYRVMKLSCRSILMKRLFIQCARWLSINKSVQQVPKGTTNWPSVFCAKKVSLINTVLRLKEGKLLCLAVLTKTVKRKLICCAFSGSSGLLLSSKTQLSFIVTLKSKTICCLWLLNSPSKLFLSLNVSGILTDAQSAPFLCSTNSTKIKLDLGKGPVCSTCASGKLLFTSSVKD
jgi:hypothetical protein